MAKDKKTSRNGRLSDAATMERDERIAVLFAEGMAKADIARKEGVSRKTVGESLKRTGNCSGDRRNARITDEEAERYRAMNHGGMSLPDIAKSERCSRSVAGIRKAFEERGIAVHTHANKSRKGPPDAELRRLNKLAAAERMRQPLFWEGGSRGASSLWQETAYG